jgi:hypothetical protein
MPQTFRTTVSLVYWTDTTEESDAIAAEIVAVLPPEDQASTLVTVEYKSAGRPVTPPVPA